MIVIDVPIELNDNFLVFFNAVLNDTQSVIAVPGLGNIADLIDKRLGHTRDWSRESLTLRATVKRIAFFCLFIRNHEEQLVLDDRAGQNAAILLGVEVKDNVPTLGPRTRQIFICVRVESGTVEFITT